ncbi:urea carboxylase [Sulfuriferula multivorans]|uniref:Urea carboxylase n=1 Tax=Sulfuriferula multivorans TaxID=1559896 RepID=A0A401JZ44_9PROT|nr:urea carboxylase [Sulfuriferula multivorans]GCB01981.1 urea carboxylase [Sulfuriferula multivorans]
MFHTVLVANRGEIAVRTIRTLKKMGIRSVAVYSDADRNARHVVDADEAIALGGNSPAESYLRGDKIIEAAKSAGAQAIIPGYGFLSENADFAEACEAAGLVFIGPTPEQMRQFGLKHTAREIAGAAGVSLTPGTGLLADLAEATQAAARLGYPVMLKSTAGGGGIGLSRCNDVAELVDAFETVQRLGKNFFSDGSVFLERFVENARHVEVQIFGDGQGNVAALGERDCSLQRRNQKVVEETPAPNLPPATRAQLLAAAVRLGKTVNYRSAGTIEFIYDAARDAFYFLEVNTRLQVEHPITEAVTGIDLIAWMVSTAAGEPPALDVPVVPQGAAIEVRIYAEDPVKNFQPSPGVLTEVVFPEDVRVDTWVSTGVEVSAHYDPMLAKLIAYGDNREAALAKLIEALDATSIAGIATNLDYLRQVVASPVFVSGNVSTAALEGFRFQPSVIEVVEAGTYSTVQDYPGRIGYWDIGVPPSGPMDDYAFRLANRIVGNYPGAAALECTIQGATLKFHCAATIALSGAPTAATLDGNPVAFWQAIKVKSGQKLVIGKVLSGCRTYFAVRGGLDVPVYLGSRSTFALGQFGGHGGRPLRVGDMLAVSRPELPACTTPAPCYAESAAPTALIPEYSQDWEIGVLYGPHGAPDFFTDDAIEMFFSTAWEVHYNSNRLGIRLNGPKPTWARSDGGEAGLHPSNIHDCEYAIGSINFTGDMPVILTRDGPSLGGFVCPATIARAELWKVGQVKPGDSIRFLPLSFDDALALERAQDEAIETLSAMPSLPSVKLPSLQPAGTVSACVLRELPAQGERPDVAYRQAGDKYILLEYGANVLDLHSRLRIHALMEALKANPVDGILELSPGVRSLQIHYDSRTLHQTALLDTLCALEAQLPPARSMRVSSRIVHLPLAFEDSATLDAVARYRQSVKDSAPWLPSNVEFIRRINGLASQDAVRDIVFNTSYMVLGLGDVYLGAPCAVPVDPRHRLLTSKYNPARTYTAEGTVGIGGVYMCIYGMDSPGGYQLIGRTLPIWNKFLKNPQFEQGAPWLLRFFDQVRYYPVSETELNQLREDFREGRASIRIEDAVFDLAQYDAFLRDNAESIADFQVHQQAAFKAEIAHWQTYATETAVHDDEPDVAPLLEDSAGHIVASDISGSIWKLLIEAGSVVKAGDPLLIVEAMKMEFSVYSPVDGTVCALHCRAGKQVTAGDALVVIEPA